MSDTHSNQLQSLEEINRQENESDKNKIDADRATCSSEYHQLRELHDSRYWHAACRVRDCKYGKVGSSCCKAGWKNAIEEPLLRSISLGTASKRPGSVTMLPPLFSNLIVSRARSEPCIFGKDFLRITLPLPGEPSDCGAKGHAIEKPEHSVVENLEDDKSIHNIVRPRIDDIKEERTQVPDTVSLRSERNKHQVQRGMQYKSKSKEHYLTSAEETEAEQAEEEGIDEGYLVFEEHEDQQVGRFKDEGDACDDGEEESMLRAKQDINYDHWEEELFRDGEVNSDNSSKGYKEDDIWSDEHFVSSQAKGFPPPISILANETHPGLPGHMPRTLWRSVKRDGRFVLQEVQAQPREFFRATRECGRLRLQLVRPDSDPVGSYKEVVDMFKDDSAGTVSIACPSSIEENLAGILDTVELEDSGIVCKGDMLGTSIQRIDVPQPGDCWTSEKGAKLGAALDKDEQVPSASSPKKYGSVCEGETPDKKHIEMFGVGVSAHVGFKECPESTGRDELIKISCVTNHSQFSEESLGGKMALDEMLGRTSNLFIAYESHFQDIVQEEVGRVSEMVKVDNMEKPVGLCLRDVEVGIPSDTEVKQNVGQIDGERKMKRIGVADLCTKLDIGQVEEDLGMGNHNMPLTVIKNSSCRTTNIPASIRHMGSIII